MTESFSTAAHDVEHVTDPNTKKEGYIAGTDYTLPYESAWSRIHTDDKAKFAHVNCGYLSTLGVPPTLLALKQHAQSLALVISMLNPSVKTGVLAAPGTMKKDYDGSLLPQSEANDAFDWLVDLDTPYSNDDPNHNKPLNTLSNVCKERNDITGTTFHCPLHEIPPRKKGESIDPPYMRNVPRTPLANHHNLVMHANECLERLDHEFSATGGLLSLIPEDGKGVNSKQLQDARNSLLGQFLTWTQHLVLRQHEFEIAYGNLLTVMAGEAVAPMQHLSLAGPDGRAGREIAYPQDRWVLANAGDDVFNHLHDILDQREALIGSKEDIWRKGGVSSERTWQHEHGGYQYARGIVPVNINTRYYRLRGQGRNTIFVVPAWEHHPAAEAMIAMEKTPKVVSVVTPKFPQRVSEFERKCHERLADATAKDLEIAKLRDEIGKLKSLSEFYRQETEKYLALNKGLMVGLDDEGTQSQVAKLAAELEAEKKKAAAELRAAQHKAAAELRKAEADSTKYKSAWKLAQVNAKALQDRLKLAEKAALGGPIVINSVEEDDDDFDMDQ